MSQRVDHRVRRRARRRARSRPTALISNRSPTRHWTIWKKRIAIQQREWPGRRTPMPKRWRSSTTAKRWRAVGRAGRMTSTGVCREMDAEGCAAEILHSGTQSATSLWYGAANRPCSEELRWAGARAYHRWAADFMAAADGRLVGVADPGPCRDMDATIAELEWLAGNGFVSVGVPGIVADTSLPPLFDPYYDRFWAACADLGLVLSVHAGWGQPQGLIFTFFDAIREKFGSFAAADRLQVEETVSTMMMTELHHSEDSPFRLDLGPRQVMWQLMLSGAFDRHPGLRLALTEVRADWVPATLASLDRLASESGVLNRTPNEYYAQHCAVSPSSIHLSEIAMRHEIGISQIFFGMDYPHHEGTWPNTREWIEVSFAGVPEDEARLILGENAIEFYHLDHEKLERAASRIGPHS